MHTCRALVCAGLVTILIAPPVFAAPQLALQEEAQMAPFTAENKEPSAEPDVTAGVVTLGSAYLALPVLISSVAAINQSMVADPGSFILPVAVGAVGLPVAIGSGHIYAGDPVRGIGLGALAYPVTLGGAIAGYLATLPFVDPKGYAPGVMEAIIIGLASGATYSLCVAWDASQTPLRRTTEQQKRQPQKLDDPWLDD